MAKAEGLSGTSKEPQISVRTPIDVDGEGVLFAIYLTYPLAYFFFFREGITKCCDDIYNKVTDVRQYNKQFIGVTRLHVSTC